jgi:hypothetical protein
MRLAKSILFCDATHCWVDSISCVDELCRLKICVNVSVNACLSGLVIKSILNLGSNPLEMIANGFIFSQ